MTKTSIEKKDYEIIAKYIKDISFEIPSPDNFVDAAQNLGSYTTKLDINSKPYKKNLIELNCKFHLKAPEIIKKRIHAEICVSILFKIINTKITPEEMKKIILVKIPKEHFDYMKDIVTYLFQKSGFKNFNLNKEVDFEELYREQYTN